MRFGLRFVRVINSYVRPRGLALFIYVMCSTYDNNICNTTHWYEFVVSREVATYETPRTRLTTTHKYSGVVELPSQKSWKNFWTQLVDPLFTSERFGPHPIRTSG